MQKKKKKKNKHGISNFKNFILKLLILKIEFHIHAALEFQHFLPQQIKCRGNYMKIHFASAHPRQCFCRGW